MVVRCLSTTEDTDITKKGNIYIINQFVIMYIRDRQLDATRGLIT